MGPVSYPADGSGAAASKGDGLGLSKASSKLPVRGDPTEEEMEKVRIVLYEFGALQTFRNTTAGQWEEIAALIDTNSVNTFFYGSYNFPGLKKTFQQIDATGMVALNRFTAILDSLLTPRNQLWHTLTGGNEDVKKDRASVLWLQQVTRLLFRLRYSHYANFSGQNSPVLRSIGAYGTGCLFMDQAEDEYGNKLPMMRYKNLPLGEMFLKENHQGLVNGFIRWFRLTAKQTLQMFGPEKFPKQLEPALDAMSQFPFNFLHRVCPNDGYEPGYFGQKGKKFISQYVCLESKTMLREGGYDTFPLATGRWVQAPGEVYGRSPAMLVLPALKTINAEKATLLKAAHRAADPILLIADDGLLDVNMTPGAQNRGGMNADGKPLVGTIPIGNVGINEKMLDREAALINDEFLVSLFQIMTKSPQMTATEVIERVNEKGILIAPNAGRLMSEYLGSMIHRELSLLASLGLLPPMPPLLKAAKGAYEVEYTSPLARSMRAQDVAGFQRSVEVALQIVNATQDPSHLDVFSFDRALPEVARIQATPELWLATDQEIKQKRQVRAQQMKEAQDVQAMPARAAMMKAQAVQAEAAQKNGIAQARGQQPGEQNQAPGAAGVPTGAPTAASVQNRRGGIGIPGGV